MAVDYKKIGLVNTKDMFARAIKGGWAVLDELAVLDGGKCILQLRGVRPFLSNKYDLTKHPLYRYTADYDKKYAFDIERFLSHRLKLKPDDAVEVYQADLSGEPVA